MAESEHIYVIRHDTGVHLVSFRRDLFDQIQIEEMKQELRALVESEAAPKVLLDLGSLRHVPSSFLGVVLDVSVKLARRGGQLRVCCMRPAIAELFELMNLNKIVQVHPGTDAALASFH